MSFKQWHLIILIDQGGTVRADSCDRGLVSFMHCCNSNAWLSLSKLLPPVIGSNSGLMILFHGKSVDLQLSLAYGGSCVILTRLHDLMLVVIIFCKRISLDFRLNISYCIFSTQITLG